MLLPPSVSARNQDLFPKQLPRKSHLHQLLVRWIPSVLQLAGSGLLFAGILNAEIQTQHVFDTSLKHDQFELLWHFRVRTKPEGGGLFQLRTGPILEFDLNERITLIGGYYFTRQENEQHWITANRPFAGGEIELWDRAIEVDWRSLVERVVISHEPDYFRFRNRFRISPPGTTAPYVGVEFFVDAKGLRSTRYLAGVRRTLAKDYTIDFGYFFEDRRPAPAGERHMFSTSFHWRNKSRRIDPDF
jgi:hypothetical protein